MYRAGCTRTADLAVLRTRMQQQKKDRQKDDIPNVHRPRPTHGIDVCTYSVYSSICVEYSLNMLWQRRTPLKHTLEPRAGEIRVKSLKQGDENLSNRAKWLSLPSQAATTVLQQYILQPIESKQKHTARGILQQRPQRAPQGPSPREEKNNKLYCSLITVVGGDTEPRAQTPLEKSPRTNANQGVA